MWSSMPEDQVAVDREIPVGVDQVAVHRVDGLDGVLRVRHEHHAVADQRRPLLAAIGRRDAAPDQPQAPDTRDGGLLLSRSI